VRQVSGAEREEDQAATAQAQAQAAQGELTRLTGQLLDQVSLTTQLELQLKTQQTGNKLIMQQWQTEQAARVGTEQQLEGAHRELRAAQLRLRNQQVISATAQSQLQALQAAQQAAGSEVLAQLQARYQKLMNAYNVGREMFELGRAEMARRDAAHAQLVQLHMHLADSEQNLERQNRTLTLRLHQLILQRNALQAQAPPYSFRRQLAEVTQERDNLLLRADVMEQNSLAQYALLAEAERTIERLRERINKSSGHK
jgi:hypothetical protein